MVRIHDTLSLNEFEVSEALADDLSHVDGIEILTEPYELRFDAEGNLRDFA